MPKKIFTRQCSNCLFSKNRIVSKERAEEIVSNCHSRKSTFTCHKSKRKGKFSDVMCAGFWRNEFSESERSLSVMAGWVTFVEHENDQRMPSHEEMENGKTRHQKKENQLKK
jgi:hypothetical protein